MKIRSVLLGVIGLLLIVSAFSGDGARGQVWGNMILGGLSTVVGMSMVAVLPRRAWLAIVFGMWCIAAALADETVVNNLIAGSILAITGFSILAVPVRDHRDEQPRRAA